MQEYRGVEIKLSEVDTFVRKNEDGSDGVFTNGDGLVFVAQSKFGESIANNGPDALAGAKKMIDFKLLAQTLRNL